MTGPEPSPGPAPSGAPEQEELQRRLEQQLQELRVQDLLLESVVSVLNLAARRIAKEDERYIISDLNTMGWAILLIGIIQIIAAFSIWAGGEFGRWIGVLAASLSAIGALLSMPGFPLWSVCVFFIDVLIIYGLVAYGGHQARST